MNGFTGIPGQTKKGAKTLADALYESYKKRNLAHQKLQSKNIRSRPNFWSEGYKFAQDYWPKKASSSFAKAQAYKKRSGPFNKYMTAMHSVDSIAYYAAGSAAKLGPKSWFGAVFDLATALTPGKLTIKVAQSAMSWVKNLKFLQKARALVTTEKFLVESAKAGEIAVRGTGKGRSVKAAGKWVKVPELGISTKVQNKVHRAASKAERIIPKYIEPISINGRKIVTPRRAVKAVKIMGNLIKNLTQTYVAKGEANGGYKLQPRSPFPNIASQIHVNLPTPHKFQSLPPLNQIKGLPKFKRGLVPGPKIGDFFKNKQMVKMKKYTPPLRPHKPSFPPPFKYVQSKSTSQPFNWNSNAIPPKSLQSTYRPSRPGQPGWGQEVSRSRPASTLRNMWQQGNKFSLAAQKRISTPPMRQFQSNTLRQMSRGL